MIFYPSRIPDPGVKKAPDPRSGFATLFLTVLLFIRVTLLIFTIRHCEVSYESGRSGLPVAAAADGLDEVDKVVRGEGQLQRAHLVQHTAQGPHVRLDGTRKAERFKIS